jgi:hypothetical protein
VSKATRVEKLLREVEGLEASYEAALIEALGHVARGERGLFGQTDSVFEAKGWKPVKSDDARDLLERGKIIAELRTQLVLEPFHWHERFLALRGRRDKNTPGEPALAAALLEEIKASKISS